MIKMQRWQPAPTSRCIRPPPHVAILTAPESVRQHGHKKARPVDWKCGWEDGHVPASSNRNSRGKEWADGEQEHKDQDQGQKLLWQMQPFD
jgi:hypothetical protein